MRVSSRVVTLKAHTASFWCSTPESSPMRSVSKPCRYAMLSGLAIAFTEHVLEPAYGLPTGYGLGDAGFASHVPSRSDAAACATYSLPSDADGASEYS